MTDLLTDGWTLVLVKLLSRLKMMIIHVVRQASEEKIWELCQKWIRKNGMFKDTRSKHVILFHLPPRYGYESILQHVYRKSLNKWQVHVTSKSLTDHMCGSAVAGCTNTDTTIAQWIHACTQDRYHSFGSIENLDFR